LIDYVVDQLSNIKLLSEIVVVSNNKFAPHFQKWADAVPGRPLSVWSMTAPILPKSAWDLWGYPFCLAKGIKPPGLAGHWRGQSFRPEFICIMDFAAAKAPAMSIGVFDIKDISAATKFGSWVG